MHFLNVERDRERALLEQRQQVLGERRQQLFAGALLHVERPAMPDQRRHVHEAVVRSLVGDPVGIGAMCAHAQPAEGEHASLECARMQLVE